MNGKICDVLIILSNELFQSLNQIIREKLVQNIKHRLQ